MNVDLSGWLAEEGIEIFPDVEVEVQDELPFVVEDGDDDEDDDNIERGENHDR